MDDNDLKGLIGAVGKNLALQREGQHIVKTLEDMESPAELKDFLESAELGVSEPSRSEFIRAMAGDAWRDRKSELAYSVDLQSHEFRDPSA